MRTCLCTQRLPDSTLCSLQDDRSGGLEKQENVAKDENLESFKLVLSLSLSLSLSCSRTNPYGWEACHLCLLG